MKARSIIGSVLAAVIIFQSCTKDEVSEPQVTLIQKIVKDVPADTILGVSQIVVGLAHWHEGTPRIIILY
jgi:hypothetical protein